MTDKLWLLPFGPDRVQRTVARQPSGCVYNHKRRIMQEFTQTQLAKLDPQQENNIGL